MGAPAIVIASAHHRDVLGEAFARYEREYDVRLVGDELAAKACAKDLMGSGHQVALFVIDSDHEQDLLYAPVAGTRQGRADRAAADRVARQPLPRRQPGASATRSPPARSTHCC